MGIASEPQATAKFIEDIVRSELAPGGRLSLLDPEPCVVQVIMKRDPMVPGGWAIDAMGNAAKPLHSSQSPDVDSRLLDWAISGDTGISSEAMVYALFGKRGKYFQFYSNWPKDNSDLGRCLRMIERFPEVRGRLDDVWKLFPAWHPMIKAWDELEALYREEHPDHRGNGPKLYARMKQIEKDCEKIQADLAGGAEE